MRSVSCYLSGDRSQCLVAMDTADLVLKPVITPDIALGVYGMVRIHGVFTTKKIASELMQWIST